MSEISDEEVCNEGHYIVEKIVAARKAKGAGGKNRKREFLMWVFNLHKLSEISW